MQRYTFIFRATAQNKRYKDVKLSKCVTSCVYHYYYDYDYDFGALPNQIFDGIAWKPTEMVEQKSV